MKKLKWRALIVMAVIGFCCYQIVDKPLKKGMDLRGGTHLVVEVQTAGLAGDERAEAVEGTQKILQARIDEFIMSESTIQRGSGDRLIIQIPGIDTEKSDRIKELIIRQAYLEFRLVIDTPGTI